MQLPSKTLTYEDMSNYGYTWPGMLPITLEEAVSYYNNQHLCIYKLYEDGTESMINTSADFQTITADSSMYGIEEKDWIGYINTLDIENER